MSSLSPFQILLWLSVIFTQIALAVIVRRRRWECQFPLLSLFIYFINLQSLSLFFIVWWFPRWTPTYAWSYYLFSLAGCTILLFQNAEIYNQVFGPRIALPEGTPRRVALALALTVSACATLGYLLRSTRGDAAIRILNTTDGVLQASSAAILWFLWFYSKRLGITWNRPTRGIAQGLLLSLTVKSVAVFLTGMAPAQIASAAAVVGQVAYLIGALRWCYCLAKPQEAAEPITAEMVGILTKEFSEIQVAAHGHMH